MKYLKIICLLIFVINTSFYEALPRMWIGYYRMADVKTNWYGAKIIIAPTLNEAKRKFNTYIKTDSVLSKCTFIGAPSIGYKVDEFFEEDILK